MATVLWAGPGAVLSHLAAAVLWRVWRRGVVGIDVVAPRKRADRAGVRAHRCRNLDPRDITRRDGIPVTTVARTLVDLTDVLDRHRLANVIHEAAFLGVFDVSEARAAIKRSHGRRHLARLERALEDHAGGGAGTKSNLEDRFLALVRKAGLPEPLVNTKVAGIEVDFHWPDRCLCVEVDGAGHERPRTRAEDRRRDRALKEAGQTVVRVTREEIEDPRQAPARVRARLAG